MKFVRPFASLRANFHNWAAMPLDFDHHAVTSAQPPPTEREPNLLRFGLRPWFYFISAAVIFCALLARLDGVGPFVVGSVVLLIAAHVFGTFLGTRLRDTSHEVVRWKARAGSSDADAPLVVAQPVSLAEMGLPRVTSLADRTNDAWRTRWALGLGAVGGLLLGWWGIRELAGPAVSWPGRAFGAVSCGVIGAWAALLIVSFWAIIREAWRQASREE